MAKKDLKPEPHYVSTSVWWAEENSGMYFCLTNDSGVFSEQFTIPWRVVRAALARKDKGTSRERKNG